MATMASWRNMTFEVSEKKVNALENLSFSYEQIADENNDAEDKPKTNKRGTVLWPLSFSVALHSATGIDVRKEIDCWRKLVTKKGQFYLNKKPLGPVVQLRKLGVGDIMLDDFGRMRTAVLTLEFKEYDRKTTSVVDNSAYKVGSNRDTLTKKENPQIATATVRRIK